MNIRAQPADFRATFEALATRWPDRIALLGQSGEALSFSELWARIQSIAASFEAHNIARDSVIVVSLSKPYDNLIALLGAMCHCVVLPMPVFESDTELERLGREVPITATILDSNAAVASHPLTAMGALPLVFAGDELICPLQADQAPQKIRASDPALIKSDDCLLIRTSGTLGAPKLVAISQASLITSAQSFADWMDLRQDDRSLCVMPLHHLHAIHRSILPFLVSGGSVVCVDGPDTRRFSGWLQQFEPTVMTATPTIFDQLLTAAKASAGTMKSFRILASGSDTMSDTLRQSLQDYWGVSVLQFYGLSEAAPALTVTSPDTPANSVGEATAFWQLAFAQDGIVDPAFTDGEIVAKGGIINDIIVDGIRQSPALTEDGWLLTGDLGQHTDNGSLLLRGRSRDMINKAGVKIDPTHVEAAAKALPDVADAVSFGAVRGEGEAVNHILLLSGHIPLDIEDVKNKLRDLLPFYALPDEIHPVAEVPRSPSSKVNREDVAQQFVSGKLALLDATMKDEGVDKGPADIASKIKALFKELLAVSEIEPEVSFFDQGGDSFLALQLILEIEDKFGRLLAPNELMAHASVAALTGLLDVEPAGNRGMKEPLHRNLVCLNDVGDNAPVYLAPGVNMVPPYSRTLNQAFVDAGLPVFSFDFGFITGSDEPVWTLSELASACVEAMRSNQPEGPYIICGFSFGAQVAFEMARQVVAAGMEVSALVLLDDHSDLQKTRATRKQFNRRWIKANILKRARLMLAAHAHQHYEGPIHLVRATDDFAAYEASEASDWEWLTTHQVTVLEIPCDHSQVMRGAFPGIWARWIRHLTSPEPHESEHFATKKIDGKYNAAIGLVLEAQHAAIMHNPQKSAKLIAKAYRQSKEKPSWLMTSKLRTQFGSGQYFRALGTLVNHWVWRGDQVFPMIDYVQHSKLARHQQAIKQANWWYRSSWRMAQRLLIRKLISLADSHSEKNLRLLFQLSVLAERCGRQDVALKNAERVYRLSPSVRTTKRLAVCLADSGERDAAQELLRKALTIFPGSRLLLHELCRNLVATQGWSEELWDSIETACSEDSDRDRFIDELRDIATQNGHGNMDPSFLAGKQGGGSPY